MKHLPPPCRTLLLSCFALALSASTTAARAVVTLPNLPVGSEYELIFVTSGTITATSPDISVYNSFVISQAALSPSLPSASWSAVVSTPGIDAVSNAPTYSNIPIYNTAGQLVASGSAGFWSGSLQHAINYDQQGTVSNTEVWTGTNPVGGSSADFGSVHQFAMGESTPQTGNSNPEFVDGGWSSYYFSASSGSLPVYALSSPITISAVPEPKAWAALIGLGAMGVVGFLWRRRRRGKSAWQPVAGRGESCF